MSDTRDILEKVASGEMTVEEAELQLKMKPFVDLGFAKPDLHRGLRQGVPEVITAREKLPNILIRSLQALWKAARRPF